MTIAKRSVIFGELNSLDTDLFTVFSLVTFSIQTHLPLLRVFRPSGIPAFMVSIMRKCADMGWLTYWHSVKSILGDRFEQPLTIIDVFPDHSTADLAWVTIFQNDLKRMTAWILPVLNAVCYYYLATRTRRRARETWILTRCRSTSQFAFSSITLTSQKLIPSCIMRSFDLRSTPLITMINSQYLKQPWTQTLTVTMLNPTPYSSKSYLAIRTHAKYLNQDLGNIPK